MFSLNIFVFIVALIAFSNAITFSVQRNQKAYRILPRFWTNAGFSPPAPLPLNNTQITVELLHQPIRINLDLIAALPNKGIKHIRIHWLLSLIQSKHFNDNSIAYDFTNLDKFLDHLMEIELYPAVEFMGELFPPQTSNEIVDNIGNITFGFNETFFRNVTENDDVNDIVPNNEFELKRKDWFDLTYQLIERYSRRYGSTTVAHWKFELWNEPDLHNYNVLDFTIDEYLKYAKDVSLALKSFNREPYNLNLKLQGPAGLFKKQDHHALCWGLLNYCNSNINECPIDVITYHRKGFYSYKDILKNTELLIRDISRLYPNLFRLPYANTEADPTSGWSKPVADYADVRYANTLIAIVFDHWNALWKEELSRLIEISHDNAFLSYHPYEFQQRTLFAHFRMNETESPYSELIEKPVYAALGMLSHLADHATKVFTAKNATYLITIGDKYTSVLMISNGKGTTQLRLKMNLVDFIASSTSQSYDNTTAYTYFVEYLQTNRTDPFAVWKQYGWPSYPNETVLNKMRRAQGPHILKRPRRIPLNSPKIFINAKLTAPWILLVRICSSDYPSPVAVHGARVHIASQNSILITWKYNGSEQCIKTYELHYITAADKKEKNSHWKNISNERHLPFKSYWRTIIQPNNSNETICGFYKIRAVDIFNRKGPYSMPYKV